MSKLITASLVGAIDWAKKCPESWKEKAMKDLANQLARRYDTPQSPQQERGRKFENFVYAKAAPQQGPIKGSEHFRWFVQECAGGVFQKKMRKIIVVDGTEYCLYGKADAWFPDIIKDIKTTDNWRGDSHYLGGFQHKLYCYMEHISKFIYLVAEFFPGDMSTIVARHSVWFTVEDFAALEKEVFDKVREVVSFLGADEKLRPLYEAF